MYVCMYIHVNNIYTYIGVCVCLFVCVNVCMYVCMSSKAGADTERGN
jgi:hypothetical protein